MIIKIFKKILDLIVSIENVICTVGIWLTTVLIFLAIINRYWLHLPIMWLNDLALYIFIFFMLFAAAMTTRERNNIAVDVFRRKVFKENSVSDIIYGIFLNIISIVIVSIFLPITYKNMLQAIKYPEYSTLIRWFNTGWLRYFLFFVMCLILIHLLTTVIEDIIKLKN